MDPPKFLTPIAANKRKWSIMKRLQMKGQESQPVKFVLPSKYTPFGKSKKKNSGSSGSSSKSSSSSPSLSSYLRTIVHPVPADPKTYSDMYTQSKVIMNGCEENNPKGNGSTTIQLKPYQAFVGEYFTPENPLKGILLYYSIGSGKLCTGINLTYKFQEQGWNVLWVTRTTLVKDIDKNLFEKTCHQGIIKAIKANVARAARPI